MENDILVLSDVKAAKKATCAKQALERKSIMPLFNCNTEQLLNLGFSVFISKVAEENHHSMGTELGLPYFEGSVKTGHASSLHHLRPQECKTEAGFLSFLQNEI